MHGHGFFEREFYIGPIRDCRLYFGNPQRAPQLVFSIDRKDGYPSLGDEVQELFSSDTVTSQKARLEKAQGKILRAVKSDETWKYADSVLDTRGVKEDMARTGVSPAHIFNEAERIVVSKASNRFQERESIDAFMANLDQSPIEDWQKKSLREEIPVLLDMDWSDIEVSTERGNVVLKGNIEKAIQVAGILGLMASGNERDFQREWHNHLHPSL